MQNERNIYSQIFFVQILNLFTNIVKNYSFFGFFMFELRKFKIGGNILPQGVGAVCLFLEFAKMPDFLLPQWQYNCLSQWHPSPYSLGPIPPPLVLSLYLSGPNTNSSFIYCHFLTVD